LSASEDPGDGAQGAFNRQQSAKKGEEIVSSLKNYGQYGKLQKAALMVIAHTAEAEVIRDMRDAFLEIDTSKEGFININELKVNKWCCRQWVGSGESKGCWFGCCMDSWCCLVRGWWWWFEVMVF
jgi:hypothetical protein